MARATIIHNTAAGDGRPSGGELRELIQRHGYTLAYATTDDDLDIALQDPGDLVAVAGGDGTVGEVAVRLLGRGIPLTILPVGTANNLARSIGIDGPIDRLIEGWSDGTTRPLDVGFAHGPWGYRPLVESCGLGLFAHAMPVLSALKKGGGAPELREAVVRDDRRALRRLLEQFRPRPVDLHLDGRALDDEYLMVEVMNAPMLGPRLRLAPAADPGDGQLDVVLIRERDRQPLAQWLDDNARTDPRLDVRTAHTVELVWNGDPIHIDGETWADESAPFRNVRTVQDARGALVRITLDGDTIPVLIPRMTHELR